MLFFKTNKQSCYRLMEVLQQYEKASGQTINGQKSSITFFHKCPEDIKEIVKLTLEIPKEIGVDIWVCWNILLEREKISLH